MIGSGECKTRDFCLTQLISLNLETNLILVLFQNKERIWLKKVFPQITVTATLSPVANTCWKCPKAQDTFETYISLCKNG